MNITDIRELFKKALLLQKGEIITISCKDKKEQDYVRNSLYKEKRLHSAGNLQISRSQKGLPTAVTLRLEEPFQLKAILTNAAGEERTL